jgi:phytanoyl-CoA hydroxylase
VRSTARPDGRARRRLRSRGRADGVRDRHQRHAQDSWFLDSGDKVRFFFEPDPFDGQGRLRQAKELSINKVGHALHDLDPAFAAFSRDRRLADVAQAIDMERPLLLQSMYIFKQPRIGGEVICHTESG